MGISSSDGFSSVDAYFHAKVVSKKQTKEATSNLSAANEEFTTTVQNLFKGFEVFYTSNAVGQFVKRMKVASDALSEVKVSYRKKFSFVQLWISLLNFIGKISVDVVAGIMVFAGMISVGGIYCSRFSYI